MAKKTETKEAEAEVNTCIVHVVGTKEYARLTITKDGIVKEVLPNGKRR